MAVFSMTVEFEMIQTVGFVQLRDFFDGWFCSFMRF